MFFEAFAITIKAVAQILILGGFGYFLRKHNILSDRGLNALSRLVINFTLPLLIFAQLIKEFSFGLYPDWWIFPLLSIVITLFGFLVGWGMSMFIKDSRKRLQFLSLVSFQNSGYLPLAMIAAILPASLASTMFIYLFLFLLGFNLVMWSLGPYMLSFSKETKFDAANLFNMPVIASLVGLVCVYLGWNRFFSVTVLKPLYLIGDSTMPLALLVVGADLAQLKLEHIDRKAMSLLCLAKLLILPAVGLAVVLSLRLTGLLGLLVLMQLSVPSATSLSVIVRHYHKEDLLISQGIFFSHVVSILTIPLFLSLYFAAVMIQ
ncbi:MAG: AEC family transporter [Candidatus Omnitrophota bacterium]